MGGRTGIKMRSSLTKIIITLGVVIVALLLYGLLRPQPMTIFQSETIGRNVRFPLLTTGRRVRFFTGTAFAEIDLNSLQTRALTPEFDLPPVNEVAWTEQAAYFRVAERGEDNDIASHERHSSWWRINFDDNQLQPAAAPRQARPAYLKITERKQSRGGIYTQAGKSRPFQIELGTNKTPGLQRAQIIASGPTRLSFIATNQADDLLFFSSDRGEVAKFPGVKYALFPSKIITLDNGFMRYDLVANTLGIYLFESSSPAREAAMSHIKSMQVDPHQVAKSWHTVPPERH